MRSEAARLIAELAPGDLDMVFFTNGGTEAIENAVRLARGHTGRHKVLSAYRSYHGATGTSIHADRRSAPLGQRASAPGHGQVLGPVPLSLRVPRDHARRRVASARSSTWRTC